MYKHKKIKSGIHDRHEGGTMIKIDSSVSSLRISPEEFAGIKIKSKTDLIGIKYML